ncbi:hypothetical protein LRS13_16550 [Svornostia abyssi]|uniref:Peptidase M10 metallopeptidase domain-containing protein n=1 Tax=Svornostia abyssi TaxID=2898438 RepID=A0ABY5PCG8_9ACTN|nr:hypothetical protein LRS13_16550 [Parviterribacteraceae bacterium J379]
MIRQLRRRGVVFAVATATLAVAATPSDAHATYSWCTGAGGTRQVSHVVPLPGRQVPTYVNGIVDSGMRTQARSARDVWDVMTSPVFPYVSDFWTSRLSMFDGYFGATGWAGLATPNSCPSGSTFLQFNMSYMASRSWDQRRGVACHEIGHAIGLAHAGGSCMAAPPEAMNASWTEWSEVSNLYTAFYR